jgi:acyl carrier protein
VGLDTVELIMRWEEDFGIEIPNEAARQMYSVRDVQTFVIAEYLRLGRPSDSEDIFRRIVRATVEQLGVKAEDVTLDTTFVDDLGADRPGWLLQWWRNGEK